MCLCCAELVGGKLPPMEATTMVDDETRLGICHCEAANVHYSYFGEQDAQQNIITLKWIVTYFKLLDF